MRDRIQPRVPKAPPASQTLDDAFPSNLMDSVTIHIRIHQAIIDMHLAQIELIREMQDMRALMREIKGYMTLLREAVQIKASKKKPDPDLIDLD